MSLRIHGQPAGRLRGGSAGDEPDGWASRLAKLIPAEALGLYGAGQAIVPKTHPGGLWILAVASLFLAGAVRWIATRDQNGRPQLAAVGIALVSFVLWVAALKPPTGPLDLGDNAFYASLAALIWATALPVFYKGD
jgi:hypothetical protein